MTINCDVCEKKDMGGGIFSYKTNKRTCEKCYKRPDEYNKHLKRKGNMKDWYERKTNTK